MPIKESTATLTALLRQSVERHRDRPAVSDEARTLTYAQLDRESDAFRDLLRARGVGNEDRVGLYMRRSADLFVAVLGILKAGAAYLAVDTRYPDARRDLMLTLGEAKVICTEQGWEDRLGAVNAEIIAFGESMTSEHGAAAAVEPRPDSVASVLFTSGSSGEPKAIVLEHGNLVSFACNPALPALTREDRVGQISSVSFDAFHFEIWSALAAGAHSVVLPPVRDLLATGFRRQMERYGITAMLVPTMVVNHVVREDPDAFAPLRILQAGGDVLLPAACRILLGSAFEGGLYNLYGPAEITTACTAHHVTQEDADSDTVPIGRPLDGVELRVLSPELQPVPQGEIGELFVNGPGVARGYQGRPDLTDERFLTLRTEKGTVRAYRTGDLVRQREDGVLLFVGRADSQVKIRGYRVELGEVERRLWRCPGVREAVVLPDGEGSDRRLVAFVVLGDENPFASIEDLRVRAERDLPDFMVPSQFIERSEIPFTVHGKRDLEALRTELTDHSRREQERAAPKTDTERYLASVWRDLLNLGQVGRDDNFFGLGGHSLLAFRMLHRISQNRALDLTLLEVLGNPVLKDLARVIDEAGGVAESRH